MLKQMIASAVFAVVAAVAAAHFAVTNHDHRMDHQHWTHSGPSIQVPPFCPPGAFLTVIRPDVLVCDTPPTQGLRTGSATLESVESAGHTTLEAIQ